MSDDRNTTRRRMQGMHAFDTAQRHAFFERVIALLHGKSVQLLSFDDVRRQLHLREEIHRGLQNIPLDRIVGSVGRYRDFTRAFLPRRGEMQQRWASVYAEAVGSGGLPPIDVYQVGDVYFVRDGNHRVSVARLLKAHTIEAYVTELPTPIALHADTSLDELDAAACYAAFLNKTNLHHTRPDMESLELSEPSRYEDLLRHADLHRCVAENEEACTLDLTLGAQRWYDTVYAPLARVIRESHVLAHFEGRTLADLYLWLVDHLPACVDACIPLNRVRPEPLAAVLVDYLTANGLPVPDVE